MRDMYDTTAASCIPDTKRSDVLLRAFLVVIAQTQDAIRTGMMIVRRVRGEPAGVKDWVCIHWGRASRRFRNMSWSIP